MNKSKIIFKLFFLLLALSVTSVFAQADNKPTPQAAPCYEVVLQLLVGSNNPSDKMAVPPVLSGVVKKLKANYNFSDYRLITTFLQRTSDSIEYKSLLNDMGSVQSKDTPVFSEWAVRNLRNLPGQNGRSTIQFEGFKFGARVPIVTARFKEEGGNAMPIINYESIGVTTSRFTITENEPTIVGSLATSKPDELMFLVLTVKPAE